MAESMRGMKRSHRCTEVSKANIGEIVTVMGWVQKRRNLGNLIFIDLRDRSGILQIVFDSNDVSEAGMEKAATLRSEFVVAVTGKVIARAGAVNENLATGDIEVQAHELRILSESETPPFPIEENIQDQGRATSEIPLPGSAPSGPAAQPDDCRSKVATEVRKFLADEGFLEIETPILIKSTPEGARDYLVPSRVHPGTFYALPQSPQLFKQLLMCSGYDRYFQLARCFRDEDLRADQVSRNLPRSIWSCLSWTLTMSLMSMSVCWPEALQGDHAVWTIQLPIQRMTWQEAMDRFGSDKPDIRFGMELKNVSDVVKDCGFGVFTGALANGGTVRGINAEGQGSMPRKKIDALVEYAKDLSVPRAWHTCAINEDGSYKSSFAKFMTEEEMNALVAAMDGKPGDLLLFAADKNKVVWDVLGASASGDLARQPGTCCRKTTTNSCGSPSSRCWSSLRSRIVSLPCTIHSPCPWKRIWTRSTPIRALSVRKLTTLPSTVPRSAAAASESTRTTSSPRCSRCWASPRSRHRTSSVSFWMPSNTVFRLTQDWLTAWIVSSCSWQKRTLSVRSSPSRR